MSVERADGPAVVEGEGLGVASLERQAEPLEGRERRRSSAGGVLVSFENLLVGQVQVISCRPRVRAV